MKENELDRIPEEAEASRLTVDDILKEYHAQNGPSAPMEAESAAPEAPKMLRTEEPEPAGPAGNDAPEGAEEGAEEPAKPDFTFVFSDPEEESAGEEPAGDEQAAGDEQPTGEEQPAGEEEPSRGDGESPEPGDEASEPEGEEPRRSGLFTGKVILVLLTSLISAALVGIAVVPDIPDPAWSVFVLAGLAVGCVPLLVWTVIRLRDSSRHGPAMVMLLAVLLTAAAHELVAAALCAVIFNALYAVTDRLAHRALENVMDRLYARLDGIDPSRERRLSACVDELENGRIKAAMDIRGARLLVLVAALVLAVLCALIPGLINSTLFSKWLARAAVIVAACACGGELAVVLAYAGAVERAYSSGVWISGLGTVSACADVTSVIFNKAGTLTDGAYRITNLDPVRISESQLLYLAVQAGAYSEHPLNRAIRRESGIVPEKSRIERQRVELGYGSLVRLDDGAIVGVGNIDFMEKLGVKGNLFVPGGTCVFVCVDKVCVGRIDFADDLRPDAANIARDLRKAGVDNIALMTGDNALASTNVGRRLDISEVYSDCRPADKIERLQYIQNTQDRNDRAAFVTRAGNERELLELANISVTLGVGDDSTANYPDIILSDGLLTPLPRFLRDARLVRQNITSGFLVSLAVQALTALLGVFGVLPVWGAAVIMPALSAYLIRRAQKIAG